MSDEINRKIILMSLLMAKVELNLKAAEERHRIASSYFEEWKLLKNHVDKLILLEGQK